MASGSTRVPRLATQRFNKSASVVIKPKERCGIDHGAGYHLLVSMQNRVWRHPVRLLVPTVSNLRAA